MVAIEELVQFLRDEVHSGGIRREQLAVNLGVSSATVSRLLSGRTSPRRRFEERIRDYAGPRLAAAHTEAMQTEFDWRLVPKEEEARAALEAALRELREIFHRRGRLGSRHEVLEEVTKLLFAHVVSVDSDQHGIAEAAGASPQPARVLRRYVRRAFESHLPESLAHELGPADFELRLKASDDLLATELLAPFRTLSTSSVRDLIRGPGGVDLLNDTFGHFLADSFVDEKELGQYLTPSEIVRFMVALGLNTLPREDSELLLHPDDCRTAGLILDPSCGVASFLVEALRSLYPNVLKEHGLAGATRWMTAMLESVIVGIDKSERMIKLAFTNLALLGAPAAHLHLADALARRGRDGHLAASLAGKAKLILTNPPFGAEFNTSELGPYNIATSWCSSPPRKVDSELLFLERYVDWLAPGGVLVAIIPDSVLTNRGLFRDLRSGIAGQVRLLSVVSLPTVAFGVAGTSTKTSILHLRKESVPTWEDVYFADCQAIGYEVSSRGALRRKVSNGRNDLIPILRETSRLEPPRLGRFKSIEPSEPRWDAGFHAGPGTLDLDDAPAGLTVGDVAQLVNERVDPRQGTDATFRYIEISDIDRTTNMVRCKDVARTHAPSRARKRVRKGDVLVSTVRPERRAIGVVPRDLDGAVCSTGVAVLRCTRIHPILLARLLQSEFATAQIVRTKTGIAYPAIEENALISVTLPIRIESLTELAKEADKLERKQHDMRAVGRSLNERLREATHEYEVHA